MIRVLGGGWYGCHIALSLLGAGHEVELHEVADKLFAGASGGNPARLHLGFHYPRSRLTRVMCQETHREFMNRYGHLTRTIPCNIYAVAADHSRVDFGNYRQVLRGEVDFVELERPGELGLQGVEGAVLTGERHIQVDDARDWFTAALGNAVKFGADQGSSSDYEKTIDCTFCARDAAGVDRYEVCVTGLLRGPVDRAVTIMDGPFPSIYPWHQDRGLLTITSAQHTPLAKFPTWQEAREFASHVSASQAAAQVGRMRHQMAQYWPESLEIFETVDALVRIRAMPLSGADARLVDVVHTDARTIRIRAGKIDAIIHAERLIREALACSR